MSFVDKVTKSRSELIRLVTGTANGRAAWWYVRVDPQKFIQYKIAVKTDYIDFTEFGEILFKGWGKTPPDDIKKRIEEEY